MIKDGKEQTEAVAKPSPHISWAVLRPGFWRRRRAIRRFKRFQNLVIHHERWASYIDTAPPLEKVIGKKAAMQNPATEIETQMHRLALPVMRDMDVASVGQVVQLTMLDGKKKNYSLIADFLIFPEHWHHRTLEQAQSNIPGAEIAPAAMIVQLPSNLGSKNSGAIATT